MERCDILLKRGTAIGAVLIRELTADGVPYNQSYSHCGIYDGNGKVYDARLPEAGHFELDYEDYDVYRVDLTEDEKGKLIAYCESKKTKYALKALIEEGIDEIFHIPIDVNLNGEEWCAIYVNNAFRSIGKPLTNKPFCTPNDLAWSVVCKKVST